MGVDAATVETVDDDPYTWGDEVEEKKTLARGAAAFFGGLGCILGGPLLAIAAAVAAVHTATHNSGGFGDATRSMGKVAHVPVVVQDVNVLGVVLQLLHDVKED